MSAVLTGFTQHLEQFQNHQLLNKAVLDVVGVDVPMIALAKNNTERKERTFRQAMVLLFAFIFAPVHGRFVARQVSQLAFRSPHLKTLFTRHRLHPEVLLKSRMAPLQKGLNDTRTELARHLSPAAFADLLPHVDEAFRLKLIQAKSRFLSWDMAVEGALFASLGWMKNAFTKLFLTGKNQFTGELNIVNNNTLDALYEKEQQRKSLKSTFRNALLTFTGATVPLLFGMAMGKAARQTNPKGRLMRGLKRLVRHFDYTYVRQWPMFGLAYLATIALISDTTDIIAARSKRERKEIAIQRAILDTAFMGGDLFWMWLAGKVVFRNSPIKPATFVKTTRERAQRYAQKMKWGMEKTQQFVQRVSTQSSRLFLFSFLANVATVAAGIVVTNNMTRRSVRHDAAELDFTNNKPLTWADLPVHPNQFTFSTFSS